MPASDVLRVVFGTALAFALMLASVSIRNRDFQRHRAWMIRAFAIGVAGTAQALLIGFWTATSGTLTPQSTSALIPLGWFANLAFAELIIVRARTRLTPLIFEGGLNDS